MDERRSRLSASLVMSPMKHTLSLLLLCDTLSACTVSRPEEGSLGPKQCDEVVCTQIVLRIHLQILTSNFGYDNYMFS